MTNTQSTIIIRVEPLGKGLCRTFVESDNTPLVASTKTPLFASARALAARNADPSTPIATRRTGARYVAMTSTVGVAAKLTVIETANDGPRFAKYVPFAGLDQEELAVSWR